MARSKFPKFRVLLTGGGSGGHIYPLISVAAELKDICAKAGVRLDLRYAGPYGYYKNVLELNGITVHKIVGSKLRRYFSIQNFIDIPKFIFSLFQAFFKLYWLMPDAIFSKGGPGALAVVFIARFYRIPVFIHESDTIPGLTNTLSAKFARVVFTSFSSTAKYFPKNEVIYFGNPIRRYLLDNLKKTNRNKEIKYLGFDPNLPLILVTGGSQGAQRINEFILDNLPELLKFAQVLHQTGPNNYNEVVKEFNFIAEKLPEKLIKRYKAVDFFGNEMKDIYVASDLVITRASAGAIFEIAALGKPSILIPLPPTIAASDHQTKNAYEYASEGAALVIEEANLLPNLFLDQVKNILTSEEKYLEMRDAALKFAKPYAAFKIAQIILELGGNVRYNPNQS